ncbi:hypothetical protein DK419_08275 [Methylobacterium terrae]|uniref:Uncharacterized protein n=1 Tax=Methylobacterium terrae TaxID=2202827 RepID=A0A2U8WJM8_9HYPH|nr:hypothetical protein [Methylobacterium terrae]AWN46309.1 hypothetical protein DK419_08275 [Methylobacterium terrae]
MDRQGARRKEQLARDSDRRAYVRDQIDFVRRNSDEEVHEVIIKAGLPDIHDQQLVTTVAQALQRRSLSTSPRDVLPLLLSATNIKDSVKLHERAFVIQDLLTGSAEELGEAGQDHRFGFGRLDVLRAIGFAKDLGY